MKADVADDKNVCAPQQLNGAFTDGVGIKSDFSLLYA